MIVEDLTACTTCKDDPAVGTAVTGCVREHIFTERVCARRVDEVNIYGEYFICTACSDAGEPASGVVIIITFDDPDEESLTVRSKFA